MRRSRRTLLALSILAALSLPLQAGTHRAATPAAAAAPSFSAALLRLLRQAPALRPLLTLRLKAGSAIDPSGQTPPPPPPSGSGG